MVLLQTKRKSSSWYLVELQCFPAENQGFVVVLDVLRRPWQVSTAGLEIGVFGRKYLM